VRIWEQATAAAARASPRTWWGLGRWSKTTGDLSATRPGPPGWASPVQAWLWRGEWGGAIWLVPRTWKAAYDAGGVAGLIPAKPGPKRPTEWIHWGAGTDHLLPRLIRGPRTRPVFLSERRPGPTRRPGTKDLCPTTGRARLGYDRARVLFGQHTAATHLGEHGVPLQLTMAKTRHRNPRTAMRYIRPGSEAVAEVTELLDIAPPRRN
jgi:hypothetical protein